MKVAVCDDDLIFASKIEALLIEISKKSSVEMDIEVYSDGMELWEDISGGKVFELLYLDIEMAKLNGIDVAKKIRENDTNIIIIYISGYDNYLIDLFEVEPFRFIKKPVDKRIFEKYFYKAYERIAHEEVYFEYKFMKIQHKILIKDIMYFESSGRLINIVTKIDIRRFYGKLNQIEKELEKGKYPFLRIHQSYLINYRFIKEISFTKVVLINGKELQISEDRRKKIRKKYNELLEGEVLDD